MRCHHHHHHHHHHDVLQMVGMLQCKDDQMHETLLRIPLAADEEQVTCLTIYTDGSASLDAAWPRRRTAAGWGAVVLQGKPGAEQGIIGVVGGQVILHRDHLHFLGATTRTVSTAEITGIAILAAYLLNLCGLQEVSFMVDSCHAMGVLSGQMRALANDELVQNGRALISRLSESTVVQWRHVASHTGILYNEFADRVALLASRGGVVSAIGPLLRPISPDVSNMPRSTTDEAIEFWTNVMMKPDPKLFQQKGKKRTARPRVMRWGSANVLTLHETVGSAVVREKGLSASARRLDLEAEFNASGYSIIGLQETRCRREGDRRGRHYYMIGTAASDIGQGGCELWITLKLKPGKSSITVTAQSHRWLAVNVELPNFSAAIVVAHAPPEVANELIRKQWWEEFSQIVLSMAPRSGQVWLLIDANAKLGSHTSAAVGSCHAQTQNGNGRALHSLLLEAGLFATNTFTQEGKATWFATSGHASRIDYVCAPQKLRSAVSGAGTCEEVLLQTGGRVDHLPVFADFSIQPLQGMKCVQRKRSICDVRKARFDSDAIQRFEAAIALAPAVPFTFDVDQHAELLSRFVRQTAEKVFPKEIARRKKDWISDDTWKLILAKKPILMEQRKARAWQDLCCLWKAWVAWTDPKDALSRVNEVSCSIAANMRAVAVQRYKVAELTDKVRKAMREDWCAHVDRQALEAQNAAMSHNSEQLYQVVRNLARNQSKGFKCTRIRLEDGTLASQYEEAQARWLRFHAGNFNAKIQTQKEYNVMLLRHRLSKCPHESNSFNSFEFMIWHQDFRDILSRLKSRKAAGEDCIPNEVLKAGGHAMAAQLGDLSLKVWQQQDTPIAWRGGVMATVPKKGPQDLCDSHRGVLTASTMGKAYAKKLRAELLPFLEPRAHGSQYGGLPARNTEMATHHARTIMLKAKRDKMACADLFMDVKNAFPSLAHVMVFGEQDPEHRVTKVDSLVQELPEQQRATERDFILKWLDGESALQRLGVPAQLVARLKDWHTQSFVAVEGDARVASCAKGTRQEIRLLISFSMWRCMQT